MFLYYICTKLIVLLEFINPLIYFPNDIKATKLIFGRDLSLRLQDLDINLGHK